MTRIRHVHCGGKELIRFPCWDRMLIAEAGRRGEQLLVTLHPAMLLSLLLIPYACNLNSRPKQQPVCKAR